MQKKSFIKSLSATRRCDEVALALGSDNRLISNYISSFGQKRNLLSRRTRPQTMDACNCDKYVN